MKHPPEEKEGGAPLLMRPMDAARALAVSRSTIYDMVASGKLASVRIGRSLRIPVGALRDWVARNTDANAERISDAPSAPEQKGNSNTR